MAQKNILYKSSEGMNRADFADFLRRVADKIESGKVSFQAQQGIVEVDIPEDVVVDVKLTEKSKSGGKKIDFEIEADWIKGGRPSEGIKLA
ncbi:MAG: amphi-Trp domain-containing protein [bacterium]